jgi:predicted RecB family endonuclease
MAKVIKVLKASGKLEPFSPQKVRRSLSRIGVAEPAREEILAALVEGIYDGIPTSEIYARLLKLIQASSPHLAPKYNLRRAIGELGPSGYPFEDFFAGVLKARGYDAAVRQEVAGNCVRHEIDVVAQRAGQRLMVECKFHNRAGVKSDVKDALYVYARFLDVGKSFDEGWLVTNTKMTSQARAYAACVGLRVISWDYPEDFSLRSLVEETRLYPITALTALSGGEKKELLARGIVFCKDLVGEAAGELSPKRRGALSRELSEVC